MLSSPPRVAVILPLYRSEATLRGCLAALAAQSYRDFAVHMVDSSPDGACAAIAATFPAFDYWRAARRMWPQEARNEAVRRSAGELLVFSDPDCYADRQWLARLVHHHQESSAEPVVGAIACHGRRWLDRGIHLTKFSKWLPGRAAEDVDMGPTANLLCPRALFHDAGGFTGDMLMGDTSFSWTLRRHGQRLRFAGDAVVNHHHLDTLGAFLRERFRRGRLFGVLRGEWEMHGRWRALGFCLASSLPLRLASNVGNSVRHARQAGMLRDAVATAPVVALGHAASLLGEALSYGRAALAPVNASRSPSPPRVRPATPPARSG